MFVRMKEGTFRSGANDRIFMIAHRTICQSFHDNTQTHLLGTRVLETEEGAVISQSATIGLAAGGTAR